MAQVQDAVQLERIKFTGATFQGRNSDSTKDQRLINIYPETVEQLNYDQPRRVLMVKRPGLATYATQTAGEGRGIFGWNGHVYYVIGNTVYKDAVATGTTLATSTGHVGFTECTDGGVHALFFCDGTDGYVVDGAGVITQIVDADFPSPHIPTPVYIDGYVCLAAEGTADIYNCDLEAPASWTASNFITAEELPDGIVGLARQNNYIAAFGQYSTEFFYTDPNNVTGTPFSPNQGAFLQIGSAAPYAVGQNERYCFFLGQSSSGGRTVWQLDGFQPTQIGSDAVDRVLDREAGNITNATAFLTRMGGHFFLVIGLTNRTFVYDIDEKAWHEWSSPAVQTFTYTQIGGPTAINTYAINAVSNNAINSAAQFTWPYASDIGTGVVYLLNESNGVVAVFDEFGYQDVSTPITCTYITPNQDFKTYRRKFQHQATLVGDQIEGTATLTWSDDDYQSWCNPKTLNLSIRPTFYQGGMFRRRAYKFVHNDATPLRFEGLEIMYTEGTS